MHRHKLVSRFTAGAAAAALAFGAAACDLDDNGDLDPGQEAPENDLGDDGFGDDGFEDDGFEDDGLDDGLDDGDGF